MATPQKPGRPIDQQQDQYQQALNPNPTAGFTGMASHSVDEGDYGVPKSQVGYDLWTRLVGA